MADAAAARILVPAATTTARHSAVVRATHWLTTICFLSLLVTGAEIVISHPRFYWGETGNVHTPPLFSIPIPASRSAVPTGYGYVLPDQNGWSRALHFETAWLLVFTGLLYFASGLITRHFRKALLPPRSEMTWSVVSRHLRLESAGVSDARSYNVLQRLTYLFVIFAVFPLMIWTGLAMSPSVVSAFPGAMAIFGGQQSARTLHFFATLFLLGFLFVHVAMVWRTGFWSRTRAMITGRATATKEQQ
jgi:thiosulfate reductase cytochrome b subunit